MHPLVLHWLVTTLALGIAAYILPGMNVSSPIALMVAALVLGFLNAILKPILVLMTLPLTVLTMGLFYLVLNAVVLALASVLVPGFEIASFGWAFFGAIVVSLLSTFLGSMTGAKPRR